MRKTNSWLYINNSTILHRILAGFFHYSCAYSMQFCVEPNPNWTTIIILIQEDEKTKTTNVCTWVEHLKYWLQSNKMNVNKSFFFCILIKINYGIESKVWLIVDKRTVVQRQWARLHQSLLCNPLLQILKPDGFIYCTWLVASKYENIIIMLMDGKLTTKTNYFMNFV